MQRETERKTFFIDNGFLTILSLEVDQPKLFENQIFLELLKAGNEVYYFRRKDECDFVIKSDEKITDAVQVCWELIN